MAGHKPTALQAHYRARAIGLNGQSQNGQECINGVGTRAGGLVSRNDTHFSGSGTTQPAKVLQTDQKWPEITGPE
jgi:hypothetical protein